MERTRKNIAALVCVILMIPIFSAFPSVSALTPAIPNDPLFSRQSYLQQIHAPAAWSLTTGSPKTVIAVIDSGLDIDHPDLEEGIWKNPDEVPGNGIDDDANGYIDDIHGWDFINNIPDPRPKYGGEFLYAGIHHGTLIAGIIAGRGNNRLGITGISWKSRILPLRTLDNQGNGNNFDVARAIDYAIAKKVDIINLSFLGSEESPYLQAAIRRALDAGIIVIAAVGNNESGKKGFELSKKPVYPACYTFSDGDIIGVGSVDTLGQKTTFSNYGNCIDIVAPGHDIYSTQAVNYERYGFDAFYGGGWSGTSLSAAIVTGVVALMKAADPTLTPATAYSLLRETCSSLDDLNPIYRGSLGCGNIRADHAVKETMQRKEKKQQKHVIGIASSRGDTARTFFSSNGRSVARRMPLNPFAPAVIPYTTTSSQTTGMSVFSAGIGQPSQLHVVDPLGNRIASFFAYDPKWRIGAVSAFGDVDGDGEEEIVTLPASQGGPLVKIFTHQGVLKKEFFVFDKKMRSGYSLALGDLNNDGKDEIIINGGAGKSAGAISLFTGDGTLLDIFDAYPGSTVKGVSIVSVRKGNEGQIITAPLNGKGPVKFFSSSGTLKSSLFPYGTGYDRGIMLAAGDVEGGEEDEIVLVPRSRASAHVVIIDAAGNLKGMFFASAKALRTGFILSIVP